MKIRKERFISAILCIAMLAAVVSHPTAASNTAEPSTYCTWDTISACRSSKTAPTIEGMNGKLFAGWYEDEQYTDALEYNKTVEGAYAKFVDAKGLTVLGQIPANATENSTTTNLRMLTSVDSLNYSSVQFEIEISGSKQVVPIDTVYKKINGYVNKQKETYTPAEAFENNDSQYFAAFKLTGIPKRIFDREIKITPKWTTSDGITVTGTSRTIVIADILKERTLPTYDYSLSDKTIDFSLINGLSAADITGITHEDETAINYSISGEKVTISDDSKQILNADKKTATGTTTKVIVKAEYSTYILPLKVVTLAIRTTDDFYSLPSYYVDNKVEGYFVLSNDLDFAGKAEFNTFCGYGQGGKNGVTGWVATFDGQGHVIKNLTLAYGFNTGIFGRIGFNASVMNVAFTGAVNKACGPYLAEMIYGTVENVYIEGVCTQTAWSDRYNVTAKGSLLTSDISQYGTIKNITVVATGNWTANNKALASYGHGIDGSTVVIGAAEDSILSDYTTIADIHAANAHIKAYATEKDALAAVTGNTLTSCGSTTFKSEYNGLSIYFGETRVYPEKFTVELSTYDYSLSKSTIDFSLINGVSTSDIKGITHEAGTAITYSRNGEVVTISGDSILNAEGKTAKGTTTKVIVDTADVTYILPLKVVTLAIRTTDDFYSLPSYYVDNKVEGYFVLSNDLDFAGKEEFKTFCGYGQGGKNGGTGWVATFDGQGHVIKNLTLAYGFNTGIFGRIGFNASVMNVAFTGAVNKACGPYLAEMIYGTVENVYIEGVCTQTAWSDRYNVTAKGSLLTSDISQYGNIKNVTVVATGNWTANNKALASAGNGIDGSTVVIGAKEDSILADYTTIADIQAANAHIKAYVAEKDALAAVAGNALTSCGSTTFKSEHNVLSIYFGETRVYPEKFTVELATYDYSLSKNTIDFSFITGVNAGDIKGITHEDGTAISYSKNGEVVTISEDNILNAEEKTATGATTRVIVKTADITYILPLKVVTLAIRTTDDFYELSSYFDKDTKKVEGYFVLCNDLNFAGEEEFVTYCGYNQGAKDKTQGWMATFDGQGHIIKNLSLSYAFNNGIFGSVGEDGVVKNVAFTGAVNNGFGGYVCDDVYGTLENIYVEGNANQTKKPDLGNDTGCLFVNKIVSYANVKDITVVATGKWSDINRAFAAQHTAIDGAAVVIGAAENRILGSYTTIAEVQAADENIEAYVTAKDAANAALSAIGSATFSSANNIFKIKWNGTEVYSSTIE